MWTLYFKTEEDAAKVRDALQWLITFTQYRILQEEVIKVTTTGNGYIIVQPFFVSVSMLEVLRAYVHSEYDLGPAFGMLLTSHVASR